MVSQTLLILLVAQITIMLYCNIIKGKIAVKTDKEKDIQEEDTQEEDKEEDKTGEYPW